MTPEYFRAAVRSVLKKFAKFRLTLHAVKIFPVLVFLGWGLPSPVWAHGSVDERIARLSAALAARPGDAGLRCELAAARCEHGEWMVALFELDEVDRIAPGKFATDLMRGEAYLVGRVPAAARRSLDRFIATQPGHAKALVLRARTHAALGEAAASVADYEAAWRATERPEPDLVQEVSSALAAHGRVEDSLRVLEAGIAQVGPVPGLVLLALEHETTTGRIDAALARIAALQRSAPRAEPWMAKRAALLAQAGRRAEARAAWQALIDHLAALPNLERGSHAMSILAEQAREALGPL